MMLVVVAIAMLIFLNIPNELFHTSITSLKKASVVLVLIAIVNAYYHLEYKLLQNATYVTSRVSFLISFIVPVVHLTSLLCFSILYVSYPETNDIKYFYLAISGFFAFNSLVFGRGLSNHTIKKRGDVFYLIRKGKLIIINNGTEISVADRPLRTVKVHFRGKELSIDVKIIKPFIREFKL